MARNSLDRLDAMRAELAPPSGVVTPIQRLELIRQSVAENTPAAFGVAAERFGTKLLDTGLQAAQSVPNALLGLGTAAQLTGGQAPDTRLQLGGQDLMAALGGPSAQEQEQRAVAQPAAAAVGEGAADLLTVFGGKRAGIKGLERGPSLRGFGGATPGRTADEIIESVKPGARRFALEVGDKVRRVTAGLAKRTAETAGEGAALAALGDEDVGTGALAGAGLELGTAPIRAVGKFALKNPAAATLGAFLAATLVPSFLPVGSDRVLDSITEAGDEVGLAIMLGIPASVATTRFSKKGAFARNFPEASRLLAAVPRGALTQMITSAASSPDEVVPVVQRFGDNPDQFGKFADDIAEAMGSSKKGALKDTVDRMMEDGEFRSIMRRPTLDQFGPLGG